MIRVFIIDDHPWIIDGLKYKFRSSRDEIEIIGSAGMISEIPDKLKVEDFDLFILDLWLNVTDPRNNVRQLQRKFSGKPIVILTYEKSPYWKKEMFDLKVKAYLNKEIEKNDLKDAIKKVMLGETVFADLSFFEEEISGKTHVAPDNIILKTTEKEIFLLLSRGMSQKDICGTQHKTRSAIEKVIRKVKKQYNVKSVSEVIHILTNRKEI
jgi:DNA-binding NarL/FixJ family response regulator